MNRLLGSLLLLSLVTVVGCQGNKPKYANVKGKVTYNGKPIDKGQITFTVKGQLPMILQIHDGSYSGQAMIGENNVSVSAMKHSATAPKLPKGAEIQIKGYQEKFKRNPKEGGPSEEVDAAMVDYIPPEWGKDSKETRVVEAGVPNEFDFDIKGKN